MRYFISGTRTVIGVLSILAGAAPALAQVTVTIESPWNGETTRTSQVYVVANVSSADAVTEVTAHVGAKTATLQKDGRGKYAAYFPLSGVPIGPAQLEVKAVAGASAGSSSLAFVHEQAPVVTLRLPAVSYAAPTLPVTATCTDNAPCVSLKLQVEPSHTPPVTVLAQGTSEINEVLSLGAYLYTSLRVRAVGIDSAGLKTESEEVTIAVDSGENLVEETHFSGAILDVDARRILANHVGNVVIRDRATRADTTLAAGETIEGHLTNDGAIWKCNKPNPSTGEDPIVDVCHYKNGSMRRVGETRLDGALDAEGGYAAWVTRPGEDSIFSSPAILYFYDLASETPREVYRQLYTYFQRGDVDVSPNGDLVFMSSGGGRHTGKVARHREGTTQELTVLTAPAHIQTDGLGIVWNRPNHDGDTTGMFFLSATNETIQLSGLNMASRDDIVRINNGWVGFTRGVNDDRFAPRDVWRRTPQGGEQKVTSPEPESLVPPVMEAIDPHGGIMLIRGDRRYFAPPGATDTKLVSVRVGEAQWAGAWVVVAGSHLFRVEFKGAGRPSADGGASDAGATTPDAAVVSPDDGLVTSPTLDAGLAVEPIDGGQAVGGADASYAVDAPTKPSGGGGCSVGSGDSDAASIALIAFASACGALILRTRRRRG